MPFNVRRSSPITIIHEGSKPQPRKAALSIETINTRVIDTEYAVRGEIVTLAQKIARELEEGKQHPFDKVVWCNIGNPQILGQKPITYFRQVLALCELPQVRGSGERIRVCAAAKREPGAWLAGRHPNPAEWLAQTAANAQCAFHATGT